MVELNNTFKLLRMVVFGTASFFALIVIILGALVTNFSAKLLGGFFNYAALGIATGLLTLLTLPAMLALSMVRKGAVTSMIAVEIAWTWFLWIMWVSVGGDSASSLVFIRGCGAYALLGSNVVAACNESTAITAFGFLSWILLMSYCVALFALSLRQHLRGNTGIWTKDVTETDFAAVGANSNPQMAFDNKVYSNQYPPAGTPVAPQHTAGSYAGSPYPQPHDQTGTSPYPQV